MKILFLIAGLFMTSTVLARPVDPINIDANNIAVLKEINARCDQRSFVESQECFKKAQAQAELEGKFRGTIRYAEVHYKKLTDKELHALSEKLIELRKKSRELGDAMMDLVEGELTQDKYDTEIEWIKNELKSRKG
jgi:hypothetical protein